MTDPGERPEALYYSDVLCVWAWIAHPRFEEVINAWSDRLTVKTRFVDVFGDAHGKVPAQWGERDGFERFGDHLQEVAAAFDHVTLHDTLWRTVRPTGSAPAHEAIHGAGLVSDANTVRCFDRSVRAAFFEQGRDISRREVLFEVAEEAGVDVGDLEETLRDGRALAALAADIKLAQTQRIGGSPTWRLNDGRQLLYGNVGYRTINANLEEWIRDDPAGASWC